MAPSSSLDRRSVLRLGSALGLTMPQLLALEDPAPAEDGAPAPAKAVIQVFLGGGLAAQESFDPKPYSPLAYRGEGKARATRLDGVLFGQHLSRTAQIADKLCIVRSMSHGEAAHERGTHNMLTGWRPSPALVYPSLGSVVAHELGGQRALPPYVCVPNVPDPFAGSGFLSSSYAPFALGSNPASDRFKVRDLDAPVEGERLARRQRMQQHVGRGFAEASDVDAVRAMDAFYERAAELLASEDAKRAFRIDEEPAQLRDRYGRHNPGQQLLLARRLVEAGVRYVTVGVGGFDHHQRIARGIQRSLPSVDQAFAALVQDLDERGLLDSTIVFLSTEFGRTPKINPDGGRDHWPKAFSIALAGGGFKRGHVHGATDPTGASVVERAVGPQDLARTLFTQLGIDPARELMAGGTRPVKIVKEGRVLRGLLA